MSVRSAVLVALLASVTAARTASPPATIDWRLDSLSRIGGHAATILGHPVFAQTNLGPAIEFNGSTDGIFLATNPLAGLARFTVEVLFEPASGGPPEQRFIHFEDAGAERRALLETRMVDAAHWALDTFLKDGDSSRTLLDRARTHPAAEWHVAALVYDGKEMSHYVDGVRELAGPVAFRPMGQGRTSIGVRQNRVYWFKGRIARVRITPDALDPARFIQVKRGSG